MSPTRVEVLSAINRTFPDEDIHVIMNLLDTYGVESYERERERVQLAILKLSDGSVDRLLDLIRLAKIDYRDVLLWAEYNP